MIEFKCPQCNSSFSVPEALAGRRARCKKCGTPLTIPAPEQQAVIAAMMAAAMTTSEAPAAIARPAEPVMASANASDASVGSDVSTATATMTAPSAEVPSFLSAAAAAPVAAPTPIVETSPPPIAAPAVSFAPPQLMAASMPVTVPLPSGPRLPPRVRRLKADAEQMRMAFENFPLIKIRSMLGDPPDVYELEYYVKGLERIPGRKEPIERNYHTVEIRLTSDYPRMGPACKILTPIFHPNIEPASICVGDHWTAGERLVDLAVRIAEMIGYQAYNIKSPLDAEAAMWADLNMRNLPIDERNMRPPELD